MSFIVNFQVIINLYDSEETIIKRSTYSISQKEAEQYRIKILLVIFTVTVWASWRRLAFCQPICSIVHHNVGHARITLQGVHKVSTADSITIAIATNTDHGETRIR